MSGLRTPRYDPKQLDDLFLRARTVLGSEIFNSLPSSKPRNSAFLKALQLTTDAAGGPEKVTDEQILGAFETALEVWPVEAEIIAGAMYHKEVR
jgi:hypothetical protein